MTEEMEEIKKREQEWEENVLKPTLGRFGLEESRTKFYSAADVADFDFLTKVGFPGEYPFTAGTYAISPYMPPPRRGLPSASGLVRAMLWLN